MVQGPNDLQNILNAPAVKPVAPSAPAKPKAAAAEPAPAPRKTDSVEISPRAAQAAQLLSQVQSQPEVRPDRVEEVRAKISALVTDNASLNAKIAEKLLTEN
jgi:anti-sigma28 factor (negative regulator of flagellin synthesis)